MSLWPDGYGTKTNFVDHFFRDLNPMNGEGYRRKTELRGGSVAPRHEALSLAVDIVALDSIYFGPQRNNAVLNLATEAKRRKDNVS